MAMDRELVTCTKGDGFWTRRILCTIRRLVRLSAKSSTVGNMAVLILSISCIDGNLLNAFYHAAPSSEIIRQSSMNSTISSVIFKDYDVTVMLFHSAYLVDIEQTEKGRVMKLDSLKNGDIWKTMDVLVFNSWLWWYRRGPKQPWDYLQYRSKIVKDMDRMFAYKMALRTWTRWVNSQVNATSTKIFFQGISPSHYNGSEWNEPGVTNCLREEQPVDGSTYPGGKPMAATVLRSALAPVRNKVQLLDITLLSQLRKDAHPSRYNGFKSMDCTHWCVPGLPDIWNQLLFASLFS
ncbi:PREDICTED: protein trichome birefringence-like 40 [Tarenaya hassleriana]|uniref:protein trichome birefringence-like 40 n=1 Tax=Tarenaya hassleriana TaxID=28532 RepID=UPI0008FD3ADC|nr:PREDICTED: protein trichome birefringence-like 40 [Tarenaya hassleriana]